MAGLEDLIRSSAPGGSIGKPLMLALLALLASGVLFRGGGTSAPTTTGSQPTSDEGAGGLLGGLGGSIGQTAEGRAGRCGQFLGRFRAKSAGLTEATEPSA